MGVDPRPLIAFWIPRALRDPIFEDLRFGLGGPWRSFGGLGALRGTLGEHGRPLGDVRRLPERVQSILKSIGKQVWSIEVI